MNRSGSVWRLRREMLVTSIKPLKISNFSDFRLGGADIFLDRMRDRRMSVPPLRLQLATITACHNTCLSLLQLATIPAYRKQQLQQFMCLPWGAGSSVPFTTTYWSLYWRKFTDLLKKCLSHNRYGVWGIANEWMVTWLNPINLVYSKESQLNEISCRGN